MHFFIKQPQYVFTPVCVPASVLDSLTARSAFILGVIIRSQFFYLP